MRIWGQPEPKDVESGAVGRGEDDDLGEAVEGVEVEVIAEEEGVEVGEVKAEKQEEEEEKEYTEVEFALGVRELK